MLAFECITLPTVEPVTLAEVKTHCRIDAGITGQDDFLTALITAARQWVENFCGISCIYSTWRMKLPGFPPAFGNGVFGTRIFPYGGVPVVPVSSWPNPPGQLDQSIRLPVGPVAYVASGGSYSYEMPRVQYYDTNGTLQTLVRNTDWEDDFSGIPARLQLLPGKFWPSTQGGRANPVIIDFVAGYGAAADAVPAAIKVAIKMLVSSWERNREADFFVSQQLTVALGSLLGPYRVRGYF